MKNRFFVTITAVLLISFLASCAGPTATSTTALTTETASVASTQPTESASSTSGQSVKIVFWSHDFPPRQKLDQQYMDQFMKDNPGVNIEYDMGPADDVQYLTKLTTAMAGGAGPDCFNLLNMSAGRLLAENVLAPLDLGTLGYQSLDEVKNNYVEGTIDGLIYQGKLYALPSEVSIYSMFVNQKMFSDAGLDVNKDMPTTWEDMVTLAEKLNVKNGNNLTRRMFDFTYGQANDVTSPVFTLAGMSYQLGGTIFNADQTETLINTEPWVKSLQFMQDWVLKEKLGDPSLTVGYLGFQDGSVGMFLGGSWYGPYLTDQKSPVADQYVVKPMPRWKNSVNNTGSFMYGYGEFVNAKSSPEKQQICTKLIKALASHPDVYLSQAGVFQPTIAFTQSDAFKSIPNMNVFMEDMKGTPYWPTTKYSYEIADSLGRAIQRAVMNQTPVQASLDQAKQEIDAFLKQK